MEMQKIREKSLKAARALGYPTNESLPLLDEVERIRSVSESGGRLLCLYAIVACSYGFPKEKAKKWLAKEGLEGFLSEDEEGYLNVRSNGSPDASKQWQVEALWALAWCVGCHSGLDFSDSCSDSFIQMLPDIAKDAATGPFLAGLQLRDNAEIVAKADLSYCLHWAVRDAEITGQKVPGKVPKNVIVERRRALEWMIGQDSWDDVAMDT